MSIMSVKAAKSSIGPLYHRLTAFPSQNIVIATCKHVYSEASSEVYCKKVNNHDSKCIPKYRDNFLKIHILIFYNQIFEIWWHLFSVRNYGVSTLSYQ